MCRLGLGVIFEPNAFAILKASAVVSEAMSAALLEQLSQGYLDLEAACAIFRSSGNYRSSSEVSNCFLCCTTIISVGYFHRRQSQENKNRPLRIKTVMINTEKCQIAFLGRARELRNVHSMGILWRESVVAW